MSKPTVSHTLRSIFLPTPHSSPALERVRQFIASQGEDVAQLTIDEVAVGAGVSKASVIRFCKHHGFSGYKEFKQQVIGEFLATTKKMQRKDLASSSPKSFLDHAYAEYANSLHETFEMLEWNLFDQAAERLAHSQSITWYGIGESAALAHAADCKCMFGGMNSRLVVEYSTIRLMAPQFGDEDTVVAVSRSGVTSCVLESLRQIRKASKAQVISLTGARGSPIAQASHLSLTASSRDYYRNGRKISWLASHLFLIDTLIARALDKKYPGEVDLPW